MKTAVYICGLLKAFDYTVDSINKNLIIPNNADVYVSVWNRLGIIDKNLKIPRQTLRLVDRPITEKDVRKFNNVKNWYIEKHFDTCTDKIGDIQIPQHVKNKEPIHYYSTIPLSYMTSICNTLHDNNYDRIIKIRPDLLFMNVFNIEHNMPNDAVFYSSGYNINTHKQVSDKFVGGSVASMNHFCNYYENLNDYWTKTDMVCEELLKLHMKPFDVQYFKSPVRVVRENLV